MARLVVLDAMGLAYRAYYAFIRRPLTNSRGENTSAIFGFANSVLKVRREEAPDYWALAWDGPGPTFRHHRFPDYKATRKPMPEDLLSQIEPIEEVAHALGLPVLEAPGVEADDVMGTLAHRGGRDGLEVVLVTSDKDMLQLVNPRVQLLSPVGRGEEYVRVDPDAVREKWKVSPEQVGDVLALMGDASDNVPGVPGVGEKTAIDLIAEFGSLENLYRHLEDVKRPALRTKLIAHREQALLSRELVTVRTDCDLPWGWDDLKLGSIRRDALKALARRYELARLERVAEELGVADAQAGPSPVVRPAERRGTAAETPAPGVKLAGGSPRKGAGATAVEGEPAGGPAVGREGLRGGVTADALGEQEALDLWAIPPGFSTATGADPEERGPAPAAEGKNDLDLDPSPHLDLAARVRALLERAGGGLAVVPLAEAGHPRRARLVGLGLAASDGARAYVPLGHAEGPNVAGDTLRAWLGGVLADPEVPKLGHDLKSVAHLLEPLGLALERPDLDVRVLSFLCDPERDRSLESLARDFLGSRLPPPGAGAPGRRPETARLPVAEGRAAAAAAAALFPLVAALRAQLQARDQWRLFETLEQPLIPVLLDMERSGICLDPTTLVEMSRRAAAEIDGLRADLMAMAGEDVNLDSGPQVAKVLFERLELKPAGKTPGGALSTRQEVLEELAARHPFPARLLEYRALTKLKSTYLDALPDEVDPRDRRVHTVFDQAGAATGRLSSSRPNLQNIPMRTARGRAIRRAFVAAPGCVLVGADYSQIELRVMAHLSGDPRLIQSFESGEDIHASTARHILGVEGPLDPALRARAKVANFGIMYGMGARSLARQMGIELAAARAFIDDYFRVFQGVREFLESTVREARRRGHVETLLGRRRYLPEIASAHGARRSYMERAAINTPIQGSAADLMKLAMIRVHGVLKRRIPSARLLLQVHDELLLECREDDAEAVSETVRAEMEGCFPLRVPLVVSVGGGPTWFDVH